MSLNVYLHWQVGSLPLAPPGTSTFYRRGNGNSERLRLAVVTTWLIRLFLLLELTVMMHSSHGHILWL